MNIFVFVVGVEKSADMSAPYLPAIHRKFGAVTLEMRDSSGSDLGGCRIGVTFEQAEWFAQRMFQEVGSIIMKEPNK